jgi:hypothetical protein
VVSRPPAQLSHRQAPMRAVWQGGALPLLHSKRPSSQILHAQPILGRRVGVEVQTLQMLPFGSEPVS